MAKIIDEPRQSDPEPESSHRNTPKTALIARFFPARYSPWHPCVSPPDRKLEAARERRRQRRLNMATNVA